MTATRSGALLLSDLCLEPYKAAWLLSLDLLVLDDSGNITDCALAAASGALRATILPAVAADERGVFRLTGGAKKAGKAAAADEAPATPGGLVLEARDLPVHCTLTSLTCRIWPGPSSASSSQVVSLSLALPSEAPAGDEGQGAEPGPSSSGAATLKGPLVVADPVRLEETVLGASATVVLAQKSNAYHVCGVFSRQAVPPLCLARCIALARQQAVNAVACLDDATKLYQAQIPEPSQSVGTPRGGDKRPVQGLVEKRGKKKKK